MNTQYVSEKPIIKTICASVDHTRFPEEDHVPDWARRDNKVTKGDRVELIESFEGHVHTQGKINGHEDWWHTFSVPPS